VPSTGTGKKLANPDPPAGGTAPNYTTESLAFMCVHCVVATQQNRGSDQEKVQSKGLGKNRKDEQK